MVNIDSDLRILEAFKIAPTGCRVDILKIIFKKGGDAFSVDDIVDAIKNHRMVMSKTVINNTLRLFNVRGIIQSVDPKKTLKRGRPGSLFIVSPGLLEGD